MFYVGGKCTITRELNRYRALRRAIRINDHSAMNYRKKYFRTQKSDKTAGFGSDTARIRIRQIRNSKVPIPTTDITTTIALVDVPKLANIVHRHRTSQYAFMLR